MNLKSLRSLSVSLAAAAACGGAFAIPQLQLGVVGGVYDLGTQTIISQSNTFQLYAFLNEGGDKGGGGGKDLGLTDSLYISAAVVSLNPQAPVTVGSNLGSIKIGSTTVNVTGGMLFGTPPVDSLALQTAGGASLPDHGIFPTYFYQTAAFNFSGGTQFLDLNTQDDPDLSGLTLGAGMYGVAFDIDVSGLAAGYAIHFDLYNSELARCTGNPSTPCAIDYDAAAFAPFSHDAQSGSSGTTSTTSTTNTTSTTSSTSGNTPEPGSSSLALLGLALLGISFAVRRQSMR